MRKQRLKVWKDEIPMNPWEDWDCEPPLLYSTGRYDQKTDYSNGDIVEFIKQSPTDGFIIRNQVQLCEILEIDHDYLCERELTKEEKADEIRWEIDSSLSIEQLSELCELFKLPYINHESRGYSQGDYAEVLIVLTDKWCELTGADKNRKDEILENSAKLFDDWAWGDVYGYSVEECTEVIVLDADTKEELRRDEEWEMVDSCGGFYGDNFENNGMKEHLPKELHEQLKNIEVS